MYLIKPCIWKVSVPSFLNPEPRTHINRKENTTTCSVKDTQFELAMELLIDNGSDGVTDAISIMFPEQHRKQG